MEKQKKRENSARILSDFKNEEYEMLFEVSSPVDDEDLEIFNNSSKANIFDLIREKVKDKKKDLEKSRDKIA
ncbi:MAG: hypothetical protein U9Q66_03905 [Patescibacteria group bacterium]|nr:hypothetical protein [Patescibacteria group bacterium]